MNVKDHPLNPMKDDSPDVFTCPKGTHFGRPDQATWRDGELGRVCSYCGSLHPDDMIAHVRKVILTGGKEAAINSGKPGKHYLRGRTGDEPWLNGKFYGDHMPKGKRNDPRLTDELGRAISISWDATFPPEPDVVDKLGDLVKDDDETLEPSGQKEGEEGHAPGA